MSSTNNRRKLNMQSDILLNVLRSLFIKIMIALFFYVIMLFLLQTGIGLSIVYALDALIPDFSSFIKRFYMPLFFFFPFIIFAVLEIRSNYRREKTVRLLLNSIQSIFEGNEISIELPKEYSIFQGYLEKIRMQSVIDKQRAREAEQKKNDLVVYLAHDLKTPLTSVIGYLSLLSEEKAISDELKTKYQGIALDKSYRLEELINEFFEITRYNLQTLELEKSNINLNLMLQQLIEEFYPSLIQKNLIIELQGKENVQLNADSNRLARVFDNLLKNAISYCDPNTKINIDIQKEGNNVCVSFTNFGKRIPEHKLDTIFEKFYRLDESRSSASGGSGIGLAVAKKIIELHGGTITASSNDKTTEFKVQLNAN